MIHDHVMLDLETLDNRTSAVVTAIGAVAFDPHSHEVSGQFYAVTNDWRSQQNFGRTINGDTVAWWFRQPTPARDALLDTRCAMSTEQALEAFSEFLVGRDVRLWGNGADFDNLILGSLYEAYGIQRPWTYTRNRCFRTIKNFHLPAGYVLPARVGTHHNALDDALSQTQCLQAIVATTRIQLA